jgi:hypothetical protein
MSLKYKDIQKFTVCTIIHRFPVHMSITEQDVQFVEPPPVPFSTDQDDHGMEWFSPSVLLAMNHHPLDDTIQYTTRRSFYVRWFDTHSDHRHDDSTASVTSLVPHEGRLHSDRVLHDNRRTLGVQLHRWIECILNGLPMTIESRLHQQVYAYYNTCIYGKLIPWRTEMAIRSSVGVRLVGVVDALFMDVQTSTAIDNTLVLHLKDWKYSSDVASCLSEYTLQLNMYKYILESHYTDLPFIVEGVTYLHIHIASMELVVFHETFETCLILDIENVQSVVYDQMNKRKKCIK